VEQCAAITITSSWFGEILDLTDAAGVLPEHSRIHDRKFWGNREHRESMKSCEPRVELWIEEFSQAISARDGGMPGPSPIPTMPLAPEGMKM